VVVERHENFSGKRQIFSVMAPRELQRLVLVGEAVMVMLLVASAAKRRAGLMP